MGDALIETCNHDERQFLMRDGLASLHGHLNELMFIDRKRNKRNKNKNYSGDA